jgi:hypothetical protein
LVPAIEDLVEVGAPVLDWLTTLIKDNPRTAKTVSVLALGVLGLTRAMGGVTTALSIYNAMAGVSASRTAALGTSQRAAATQSTAYGKSVSGASAALGAVPTIAAGATAAVVAFNLVLDQASQPLDKFERAIKDVEEQQRKISFQTDEGEEKSIEQLERERLNRQIQIVNAARQAEREGRGGGVADDANLLQKSLGGLGGILNEATGVQDELTRQREAAERDLARLAEEQAGRGILSQQEAAQFTGPEEGFGGTLAALQELVAATQRVANNTSPSTPGPSMEAGIS